MPEKRRPHKKSIHNEKAEKYDSDKGTTTTTKKTPNKQKKQLNDLEIAKLHEKDVRLMIAKMIQDLGRKWEAKIDKLQETLNKELEDLKIMQRCKIQ